MASALRSSIIRHIRVPKSLSGHRLMSARSMSSLQDDLLEQQMASLQNDFFEPKVVTPNPAHDEAIKRIIAVIDTFPQVYGNKPRPREPPVDSVDNVDMLMDLDEEKYKMELSDYEEEEYKVDLVECNTRLETSDKEADTETKLDKEFKLEIPHKEGDNHSITN